MENSPHPPERPSTKSILDQLLGQSNKIAQQPLNDLHESGVT
jgi:hypothetical protein